MSDRPLPAGVASHDEAWDQLVKTPWIRTRANQRRVTLHDAVAEELAQRIIPLHDQNQSWRHEQWQRAIRIYTTQIDEAEPALSAQMAVMDSRLHLLDQELQLSDEHRAARPDESAFIDDVARLDADKRELDQLKAVLLYYKLLSDRSAGCRLFLDLFGQARHEHDISRNCWCSRCSVSCLVVSSRTRSATRPAERSAHPPVAHDRKLAPVSGDRAEHLRVPHRERAGRSRDQAARRTPGR